MGKIGILHITVVIGLILSGPHTCNLYSTAPGVHTEEFLGSSAYPRLALCHAFFADQPDSILWKYDLLYGHSTTDEVLALRTRAIAAGRSDWLARVNIVQVFCPLTSRFRWMSEGLPAYVESAWQENPDFAIDKAVYENFHRGCNWFLCDSDGAALPLWGEEHHMLNMSADCPRGVWESTEGLTFVEWMCSDAFLDIFLESRWATAFDGMQVEDGPPRCGAPCWRWDDQGLFIDPDGPDRDDVPPETCEEFQERAKPHFDLWLRDCIGVLTGTGVLTRSNGHWTGLHPDKQNYPLIGECFASCKLEKFGNWSGWPYDNLADWAEVYFAVEEVYERGVQPPGGDEDGNPPDRSRGWEAATCQITPEPGWPLEQIYRWERCHVALCLMGEATFSLSWMDDPFGWEQPEHLPVAPEVTRSLGDALGPAQPWDGGWYRWFSYGERDWTVVLDIPAEDGRWLAGHLLPPTWEPPPDE